MIEMVGARRGGFENGLSSILVDIYTLWVLGLGFGLELGWDGMGVGVESFFNDL